MSPPRAPRTRLGSGHDLDALPDVRDGLTRIERIVLHELWKLEKERPGRGVPTALLYGRVAEHADLSPEALSAMLARLGARRP